jgi:type III secretory pathway component EscR
MSHVVHLFSRYPLLVMSFNICLPVGYHIEDSVNPFGVGFFTTTPSQKWLDTAAGRYIEKVKKRCDRETYCQFLDILYAWIPPALTWPVCFDCLLYPIPHYSLANLFVLLFL